MQKMLFESNFPIDLKFIISRQFSGFNLLKKTAEITIFPPLFNHREFHSEMVAASGLPGFPTPS